MQEAVMLYGYAAATKWMPPEARAQPRRAERSVPVRKLCRQANQMDRATAKALVDAGYMPLQRYIELFDERVVRAPYNAGNFGEGDV
jgi:hypothetical protein